MRERNMHAKSGRRADFRIPDATKRTGMRTFRALGLAAIGWVAAGTGCQKVGDGFGLSTSGQPLSFCELYPEDSSCAVVVDPCIANPNAEGCVTDPCIVNPDDPACKPKVKFEQVFAVFEANYCKQCHLKGGLGYTSGRLLLDADSAYASLFEVPATNQRIAPGWVRVKPGQPDSSYLWLKLSMDSPKLPTGASLGARMPQGYSKINAESLELIRQWILDGAEQ